MAGRASRPQQPPQGPFPAPLLPPGCPPAALSPPSPAGEAPAQLCKEDFQPGDGENLANCGNEPEVRHRHRPAEKKNASAPLPGSGQEQSAAWNGSVRGRGAEMRPGAAELEEISTLENRRGQREPPSGLGIGFGTPNGAGQDQAPSPCRDPEGSEASGSQPVREILASGQSRCSSGIPPGLAGAGLGWGGRRTPPPAVPQPHPCATCTPKTPSAWGLAALGLHPTLCALHPTS